MNAIHLCVRLATLSYDGVPPAGSYHLRFQDLECPTRDLKTHLESVCGIPARQQVLLLSDGQRLPDDVNIIDAVLQKPIKTSPGSSPHGSLSQSQAINVDAYLFDLRLTPYQVPPPFQRDFLLQSFRSSTIPISSPMTYVVIGTLNCVYDFFKVLTLFFFSPVCHYHFRMTHC